MEKDVSKGNEVINITVMILWIILYRLFKYLPITSGLILIIMSIKSMDIMFIVLSFVCGIAIGFLILVILWLYQKLCFESYSIVIVRKNKSHEVCAKMDVFGSRSEITKKFINDLRAIKEDYKKPGYYLTAKTHQLFVHYIIKEFIGGKKARGYSNDLEDASIGSSMKFETDDRSVIILVEYYKDKINTNKAINKFRSWSDIKKASKKIPFYNVKISIK